MDYQLMVVKVGNRAESAAEVQAVLTAFGCSIKVRLGLHDLPEGACSPAGLIILQVTGPETELNRFLDELNRLEDVVARLLTI